MDKRKIGQQIYALVLVLLLFLQSSAQVVGAVTASSSGTNDPKTVQLLEATQETPGLRTIGLKLSLNNSTDEIVQEQVSVSFSGDQQLQETADANIVDEIGRASCRERV